jgi:predicted nucleic acid-binding Zn ribbon protein
MSKCECGRRKSQYAGRCRKCTRERDEARANENRAIVETGHCPDCGAPLRRNLALAGWWQCSQYGAEGFRADDSKPSCNFQCSTE